MKDIKVKRRHQLRNKEIKRMVEEFEKSFGTTPFKEGARVEMASSNAGELIIVNNQVVAFYLDGRLFPTVKGLLNMETDRGAVTVDMGAIKFVTNGADIMSAGIVAADHAIEPGDLVWIRDERNKRPLAVGEALCTGAEMVEARTGKAVKSIHHVGDQLWSVEL